MSDNKTDNKTDKKRVTPTVRINEVGLTDLEMESFKTFYFLIFSPNPARDRVRVFIDDGSIKTSMKIDNFKKLCVSLIGIQIEDALSKALEEVGSFFIIDREEGKLKHLQLRHEKEEISVKQVFEENRKEYNTSENPSDSIILENDLMKVSNSLFKLNLENNFKKSAKTKRFKFF